ncbi:hypothetical protein PIB30_102013 [Stylosanthes scabra]|uniref:Uncharacterized protein n=1 Tax=Stylosanthes scabra TaxID=79078 RepID=A0ABU6RXX3_9FABA|nr:hypothetical protein [Stylosanthes scabra]
MGPRKEIQKKRRHDGEGSSRRNEPSHPLASWFNNPQAFETFITKWEKRRFVTPSYITYDFIVGNNYRNLTRIIEQQGFGTLVTMVNANYPDLVSACTSHLKYSASNEGGYIECYVTGRYRVIPLNAIANVCGLSMEGHRFMGGIHAHESWGPYALQCHWIQLSNCLDGYRKVEIGEDNCINERTLKKTRRQLEQQGQGVDEVEEEIDRMEQEDQGHQQPQAQATMLDLVQEMRSMNENLQTFQLETRGQYQTMNTRIGRVERSVRAIHNHLGIHYEDEDEDED